MTSFDGKKAGLEVGEKLFTEELLWLVQQGEYTN